MQNEMFEFNKNALQGVLTNPLCAEYKDEWRRCGNDKKKLVDLVLRQQSLPYFIEHCRKGKGLSKEYIQREFADYINGNHTAIDVDGVKGDYKTELYVGYNGILSVSDDVLCAMWCNIPSLEIKATKAVKLYIGCKSKVHLNCEGYNSIIVMLYDQSTLYIDEADEETMITVYRYDKKARVETGKWCLAKKVRIFDKELRL